MANTRAIKRRIRSVATTQKTTNAMQLVAASKMRRAQARVHLRKRLGVVGQLAVEVLGLRQVVAHLPSRCEASERGADAVSIDTDRGREVGDVQVGLEMKRGANELGVVKRFEELRALDRVDLAVEPGTGRWRGRGSACPLWRDPRASRAECRRMGPAAERAG